MSGKHSEDFDCIAFTRQARREIYEETKHMSLEELHEYWRKFRETSPFWQRLTAIEAERSKQKHAPPTEGGALRHE